MNNDERRRTRCRELVAARPSPAAEAIQLAQAGAVAQIKRDEPLDLVQLLIPLRLFCAPWGLLAILFHLHYSQSGSHRALPLSRVQDGEQAHDAPGDQRVDDDGDQR